MIKKAPKERTSTRSGSAAVALGELATFCCTYPVFKFLRREAPSKDRTTVRAFSIASFFHDVGGDMVFSVWPLFLTEVLKANMSIVGFIDGLGDAIVCLSQAGAGWLSDRIKKRKVFVWLGYLLGGLSRLGYALSVVWPMIIPFRILDRSGKMRSSPRDAIISDISTRENRATRFGFQRMMDNLGSVVGTLLAIGLVDLLGYRLLFALAAIPSLVAVTIVIKYIKEQIPAVLPTRGARLSDFSPNLEIFTIASTVLSFGTFSYSFLLLGTKLSGLPMVSIPMFYLLYSFSAAVTSYPAGLLADEFGRKRLLYISYASWALVLVLFLYARESLAAVIIAFVLFGIHKGIQDTAEKTFAAELAPPEYLSTALGAFQMVLGLVALPASFMAGVLWDRFGFEAPLTVSLLLTVFATILLTLVNEKAAPKRVE